MTASLASNDLLSAFNGVVEAYFKYYPTTLLWC
jgi:hypothetical protein